MVLYFFTEARLIAGEDGNYYNPGGAQKKDLFERYLSVFSKVYIVSRVYKDPKYKIKIHDIVNSNNILVFPLPYYLGPLQFLIKKASIIKHIQKIISKGNAYILRLPGNIGNIAANILQRKNIPYGVEIVGDPFEVFSKNGIKHPLKKYFQLKLTAKLKENVFRSSANLYVTNFTLQKRYPSRNGVFNIGVSDVKIKENEVVKFPKSLSVNDNGLFKIISIGTLDQMYKGPDILLRAISLLNKNGVNCQLTWIGSGRFLEDMNNLAHELQISDKVNFVGYLSKKEVINKFLDESDIFVLASTTEGLPRVIIEAFARGLPVIASNVGGIPELVKTECLFENRNSNELAMKLEKIILNRSLYSNISKFNLQIATSFIESKLEEKRLIFFQTVSENVK